MRDEAVNTVPRGERSADAPGVEAEAWKRDKERWGFHGWLKD